MHPKEWEQLVEDARALDGSMADRAQYSNEKAITLDYTNYKGERAFRRVVPISISFTSNEWHKEPQWILKAFDLDREAERNFAIKDIHKWTP